MSLDSRKPLFWLGHGIRLSGAVNLLESFLEKYKVPFITSWQGKDMIRHDHPRFFGHAGIYGHRVSNTIVQNSDLIISIGTRLALPQTGYDLSIFAPQAKLVVVDIDKDEATKIPVFEQHWMDAKEFIENFDTVMGMSFHCEEWIKQCETWKEKMPFLEPMHENTSYEHGWRTITYINSYKFMWELNKWLKPEQVIVTDMGSALLSAYPMLKLNGKQRLITSTGLGEMGFALPAAVGASIASNKGEVLCLNCDGGLMFNLQELSTIKHHKLPIKIIIFDNGGYNMIKRSQEGLGMSHTGSGASDLSFPWWEPLAQSFGMDVMRISKMEDMRLLDSFFSSTNASLCIVPIDPDQKFGPKVPTLKDENGKLYSPSLEHMQ